MRGERTTMEAVANKIRERIAGQVWRPGARIPTKVELRALFGASDMTVQRALNLVYAQGFTTSRGCRGTFVVERPPHLRRFGLVLPLEANPRVMQDTLAAAATRKEDGGWWLTLHHGCEHWPGNAATAAMQELQREVDQSRFGGLVFAGPPLAWKGARLLTHERLPRLFVSGQPGAEEGAGCRFEQPWRAVLGELARRRRRRVAVLATVNSVYHGETDWLRDIRRECAGRGLTFRDEWAQAVAIDYPGAARQAVRLLLSQPPRSRPDGLYVMDDHLVTAACEAVAGSGIPPEALTIVCHANFPNLQPAAVPVVDIGYDIPKLLEAALQALRKGAEEGRALGPEDWITAGVDVRDRASG